MRVISWNIGMARESRGKPGLHDQAWHYLLGLGPDLAFLQEALPPPWVRGEGTLVHGPIEKWGSVQWGRDRMVAEAAYSICPGQWSRNRLARERSVCHARSWVRRERAAQPMRRSTCAFA